jgi:hypothetical protein
MKKIYFSFVDYQHVKTQIEYTLHLNSLCYFFDYISNPKRKILKGTV